MKSWVLGFGLGIGGLFALDKLVMWIWNRNKKKKSLSDGPEIFINDCLLFSPCQTNWNLCNYYKPQCGELACPFCNYKKFYNLIESAKCFVDVCVYLITSEEISKLLVKLSRRRVLIRIISDKQMALQAIKVQIALFKEKEIPIKLVNSADLMHNKFVLIDRKILITGSFNWTTQAFNRNFENAIILHDRNIVYKYFQYFEYLWFNCSAV